MPPKTNKSGRSPRPGKKLSAKEDLQESHARLELALDSAAMGAWAYHIPTDFRDFDARTCRILGLDPDVFRGTAEEFFAVIKPEDRPQVRAAMNRTIHDGAPYAVVYRVIRPDGSERQISVRGTLTRGPDGRALKLSGIAWDDSERKAAEEKLARSEQRFRQLAELLPEIIFETDLDGLITFANRQGLTHFGFSAEDFEAGLSIFDLFGPREGERVRQRLGEVLRGAEVETREYTLRRRNGEEFPVLLRAIVIREGGAPRGIRGIAVDITERKQAEEQIKQSLREKEILLREIHHRTKNNMNVIISLLSLREEGADPAVLRTFREIEDRIQAMALVHQKLYQSRDLSRIDMREYLIELAGLLTRTVPGPAGRLALDFDLAPLRLSIDTAIPLGLVVTELFSNVIKHALKGDGRVTICLGLRPAEAETIELTVADDGPGMPPGFDFRTSRTMGLQTVRMLVEHQLQGRCEFEGGPGVTCRIRIPRDFDAEAAPV